ncbi:MAG: hypothetical protein DHS20C09_20000 [marine bacterium B5-7]|nr:MAG: hypothetical protein DHS20C09_20000 [marine bacterium B5-7]
MPLIENSIKEYTQLKDMGHGDEDISALIRLKRELFKLTDQTGVNENE